MTAVKSAANQQIFEFTIFQSLIDTLFTPKILHKYCLQFLLGWLWYPQEIKTIGYEKVRVVLGGGGGVGLANKVYYGRSANGEYPKINV